MSRSQWWFVWALISGMCWVAIAIVIASIAGCNEQQQIAADRIIADANDIASGVKVFLESPAAAALPPEWKLYGSLGVLATSILLNGWQEFRNKTMTKTTKAIVKGIQKVERQSNPQPPETIATIKQQIAAEMRTLGIFDSGNKLVDRLKIAR